MKEQIIRRKADHTALAKFDSERDADFKQVLTFIREVLPAEGKIEDPLPSRPSTTPGRTIETDIAGKSKYLSSYSINLFNL